MTITEPRRAASRLLNHEKDDDNGEAVLPALRRPGFERGKVNVFEPLVGGEHVFVTTLAPNEMLPSAEAVIDRYGARAGLSIAFACATCGDGLTLTLADGSMCFEWSFTSEAEDALAALRAAEDEAVLDRHWPGDEVAQGGEPSP